MSTSTAPDMGAFASPTIELTQREQQIKDLLLAVATHIDATANNQTEEENDNGTSSTAKDDATTNVAAAANEPTILRWAGGWVRDKLLGIPSDDIDTAINNMTGEAFAVRLQSFCEASRDTMRARYGMGPEDLGNLHKIERNPDKSKHLETVKKRLFGLDLDFVNLRKETYTADSRNPQVEFGTAEEDAFRRDATVNALFYNLNTGLVEDFTGGLADLEVKILRTPLQPFQTFMDDPLRVLRLVRFASRLGFEVDPAAAKVMGDDRVMDALRIKISRERVLTELEKMLKGQNPRSALQLIESLNLYHAIFTDPKRTNMPKPDLTNWSAAYECLATLASQKSPGSIYDHLVKSEDEAFYAWILAALAPFESLPDDPPPNSWKQPIPLATQAAREGIKASVKLGDIVTAAHRNRPQIVALKDIAHKKLDGLHERDRFGMAIRKWDDHGNHWRVQVLQAVLVDVMTRTAENQEDVLREWQAFLDHLVELDLMDVTSVKRLIDGKYLAGKLGVKPGKWMTPALDMVLAWQLRNPKETDPAGAVEEVRTRMGELGLK